MPISRYYGGKGEAVMAAMRNRYGSKQGERVFYATINKERKGTPAQQAIQPTAAPGSSALLQAVKRVKRQRAQPRRRQLGTSPQASGQRIEGASTTGSRIGY